MTLFNFGAIRCPSGNAIHILPEVNEFGTVGKYLTVYSEIIFYNIVHVSWKLYNTP